MERVPGTEGEETALINATRYYQYLWGGTPRLVCNYCKGGFLLAGIVLLRNPPARQHPLCHDCAQEKHPTLWDEYVVAETKRKMTT